MSRGRSAPHGFPTASVRYMATPGTREELTSAVDYEGAQVPVREDLRDAHRFLLDHIRSPGTWWTGGERVAIAAEARGAARCALCRERRKSLSPGAVQGRHDGPHTLPANVVDAGHRIRSDPARLSRSCLDAGIAAGREVPPHLERV